MIVAFVAGMVLVLLIDRRVGRRASLPGCVSGMAAITLAGRLPPLMPLLAMCLGGQNAASPRARDQSFSTSFVGGHLPYPLLPAAGLLAFAVLLPE